MMKRFIPSLMMIAFVLSGIVCPEDCVFMQSTKNETKTVAADAAPMPCHATSSSSVGKTTSETPMTMMECSGNDLSTVKPFSLSAPNFVPVIISYAPEFVFTPAEAAQNTAHLEKPPPDYDIAAFYALPAPHINSTVLRI